MREEHLKEDGELLLFPFSEQILEQLLYTTNSFGYFGQLLIFSLFLIMHTYYYVLASQRFLTEEEPLAEVLKERTRYYKEQEKEIDFWFVINPAFLNAPAMQETKASCPQPSAAVISTNKQFISWLKLRIEFVLTGEFTAASVDEAIA